METPFWKRPSFYVGCLMIVGGSVLSALGYNPLGENLISQGVVLVTLGHAIHTNSKNST
jgi:hypothetical protein